jgi:pyruvate dehydrogenase E1 component
MVANQEDVFYYVTVMNENYTHPGLAEVADKDAQAGILKGMYLLQEGGRHKLRVQLMGSGTILREVIAAAALLDKDWGVAADIWSCPSFTELRRDGLDADRWNMLHPPEKPRKSYVEARLEGRGGPVIASTDYMKGFADQIRPFIPSGMRYRVLGTDGFGRSDTREKLRHFFEVNRYWVTIAALKALADDGTVKPAVVAEAIKKYGIDPHKPNPATV